MYEASPGPAENDAEPEVREREFKLVPLGAEDVSCFACSTIPHRDLHRLRHAIGVWARDGMGGMICRRAKWQARASNSDGLPHDIATRKY